jgi:spore coat polysaccharide biosynthesis predicted glycosyltransferase SpsG
MILIRIDLGSKLGLGHYIRAKTLIKYLKIKEYKIIVDKISKEKFFKKEKNNTISLYKNSNFVSELSDAKLFLKTFKKKYKNPIIIKDSYRLNYKWEKYLTKYGKKIISIGDFIKNKHYSDVYINHSPALNHNKEQIKIVKKNNKKGCNLLIGTKFALFNTSAKIIKTQKSDITFCNGGSGDVMIYKKIIKQLLKNDNFKYKINLIIGPYINNFSKVKRSFIENKYIKVINQPDNIISYLKNTKLFVSPASTSMFESSLTKTPTLLFRLYKNQNILADKDLEKLGHYFSLNKNDIFSTDKITDIIQMMLKNYKEIIKMMNRDSVNLKEIKKNYSSYLKL